MQQTCTAECAGCQHRCSSLLAVAQELLRILYGSRKYCRSNLTHLWLDKLHNSTASWRRWTETAAVLLLPTHCCSCTWTDPRNTPAIMLTGFDRVSKHTGRSMNQHAVCAGLCAAAAAHLPSITHAANLGRCEKLRGLQHLIQNRCIARLHCHRHCCSRRVRYNWSRPAVGVKRAGSMVAILKTFNSVTLNNFNALAGHHALAVSLPMSLPGP
jgi:hypothetical protein